MLQLNWHKLYYNAFCLFSFCPSYVRACISAPVHVVCVAGCVNSSLSQGSANAAVLDVTQTGGHKKRVRRSSFLNAKKLYEDAQMARKVKQYLSKLSLETNEDSLQTLSLQCEPSISTCEFAAQFEFKTLDLLKYAFNSDTETREWWMC